ncbi:hypothetical protein [Sorangium sp. So ce128]|uniref:hypothetical protein n=1 Tax=Sorangium sp. So ce128 TaxID=3133281 RepID=UPI003F63C221
MSKRMIQANYFADDKDIFDLLSAARQKLTVQKLVDFTRRRGLVLSSSEDREDLIEQISLLPFGWHDLNDLIEATDTADRAEKMSSRALAGAISLDEVREAMEAVRDNRQNRGEAFTIEQRQGGLRIFVRYSELDPSKTRLVQRTQRDFTFDVELPKKDEVVVRHQDQARAHEVLGELVSVLASKPNQEILETKIELAGVKDPALRTEFFLSLIRGVKGFKFADVKAVKASRFTRNTRDTAPPGDDDASISDELDSSADMGDGEEILTDEAVFIAQVKEIALKGEGILHAPQYKQLTEQGFFVRSIVWTATEDKQTGPRVEFESGFDNPEEGTGFTYTIRGMFARRPDGEYRKSKAAADPLEKTRLLRLIEEAARSAVDTVISSSVAAPIQSLDAAKEAPIQSLDATKEAPIQSLDRTKDDTGAAP